MTYTETKEKFLQVCKTKPLDEAISYFNSLSMLEADLLIEDFPRCAEGAENKEKTLTVIRNGLLDSIKYENHNPKTR